ncbi:autotransporter domain-containing protein, partial [Microbacteriaceae bacterium K1510]|nr:autotransporter domain-containing protein [Microbacteriaceae bacterium K1510]
TLGGFVTGADAGLGGGWRAGVATGYARSDLNVDARLSSGDVDSYHLVGYLGGRIGEFALRGGGGWTWSNVETSRTIAIPGYFDRTHASY